MNVVTEALSAGEVGNQTAATTLWLNGSAGEVGNQTAATTLWLNGSSMAVTMESGWSNSSQETQDTAIHFCDVFKFITATVLGVMMFVFGALSNSMVMWVYWTDRQNPVPLLIMCISVLDSLILTGVTASMLFPGMLAISPNLAGRQYYMGHVHPIQITYVRAFVGILHLSNTWLIVLVTLYRFIAVCHPLKQETLKNMKRARLQIIAILGMSIIYYIPIFAQFYVQPSPQGKAADFKILIRPFASGLFTVLYYNLLYYTILYIVPFASLIYMTTMIVRALRELRKKKEAMTTTKTDDLDTTRMLLVVAGIFMLLQLLVPTLRLIRVASGLKNGDGPCNSWTAYYINVARLGLSANNSLNGLIYYVFSKRFRRKVKARLCHRNRIEDQANQSI